MPTTPEATESQRRGGVGATATQQKQRPTTRLDGIRSAASRHRDTLLLLAPGVLYLAIRFFGLLVLFLMTTANGESFVDRLRAWDGQWYLQIAMNGYWGVDPSMVDAFGHRSTATPFAFFPGYPLLIRLGALLPGIDYTVAAIEVSLVAGVVGAYGLARMGRRLGGSNRVGLLLVALFASVPMSVVFSMAYSEALFCALSIWALVGVIERRWVLAALCCAGAGLVRPTAAALIVAVGVAALVAIIKRRDGWRPWVAVLVAPSGLLAYIGLVAGLTGRIDGYFKLQEQGWNSAFDGGLTTGHWMIKQLLTRDHTFEIGTVLICLVAMILLVACLRSRMPWPLIVFAVAVVLQDLGSNGIMFSKVRLMLPAFPLLIPVAISLAGSKTRTAVWTTVGVLAFGAWFSGHSLTVWPYAM